MRRAKTVIESQYDGMLEANAVDGRLARLLAGRRLVGTWNEGASWRKYSNGMDDLAAQLVMAFKSDPRHGVGCVRLMAPPAVPEGRKGDFEEFLAESPLAEWMYVVSEDKGHVRIAVVHGRDLLFAGTPTAFAEKFGLPLKDAEDMSREDWITEALSGNIRSVPESFRDRQFFMDCIDHEPDLEELYEILDAVPDGMKDGKMLRMALDVASLCAHDEGDSVLNYFHGRPDLLDEEACLYAARNDGFSLEFMLDAGMTREVCEAAVRDMPTALQFVPERHLDAAMCALALESCEAFGWEEDVWDFVPESIRDEVKSCREKFEARRVGAMNA